jgi:hypothetical protein
MTAAFKAGVVPVLNASTFIVLSVCSVWFPPFERGLSISLARLSRGIKPVSIDYNGLPQRSFSFQNWPVLSQRLSGGSTPTLLNSTLSTRSPVLFTTHSNMSFL